MKVKGKTVVITGGTDGIGAATALELQRRGAHVWIIGRSQTKGHQLVLTAAKAQQGGSLHFLQADFSLMQNVLTAVEQLRTHVMHVDVLIHCVGILIAHKEYTEEGIEKDFAVSYLSRFVMTKALVAQQLLLPGSNVVNLAASSPKIPRMAKLEFNDLAVVESRFGMQSHGQAQMANDLFSLELAQRWNLSVVGYGPGSVDTNIRRELPRFLVQVMKPFFAFFTRKPAQVGQQLADILETQFPPAGEAWFFNKRGRFAPDAFVRDDSRRKALWAVSELLEQKAVSRERQGIVQNSIA